MTILPIDLEAFAASPLTREPFVFAMVPRFVKAEAMVAINADYPLVSHPGSFPLPTLKYGPAFRALIQAIEGPEFRIRVSTRCARKGCKPRSTYTSESDPAGNRHR